MSPACHVTSLPVTRHDPALYPGLNEPITWPLQRVTSPWQCFPFLHPGVTFPHLAWHKPLWNRVRNPTTETCPLNAPFEEIPPVNGEGGYQNCLGGWAESRDLWDNPHCLNVLKLLDQSESHKWASRYRTREGVGRCSRLSLLCKREPFKLRAAHRGTWWAFAYTLVTSQFVLGIQDYPWDKTPIPGEMVSLIAHAEQKPALVHFLLGGWVGQKICRELRHTTPGGPKQVGWRLLVNKFGSYISVQLVEKFELAAWVLRLDFGARCCSILL